MISVILPVYNEEWRAPPTVADIIEYAKRDKRVKELVVIDDGSKDRTYERLMRYHGKKLPLKLCLVRLFENRGKWAAIREGIKEASQDWILLLDGDHAARIEELRWIDIDLKKTHGMAFFGSRFMKGAKVSGKSFLRNMVSKGYRAYSRLLYRYATANKAPDDLQCPWKLFRKSELVTNMLVDRWAGDIELAAHLAAEIVDIPVLFMHQAGSKIRSTAIFSMAWETLWVVCRYRVECNVMDRLKEGNR